MCRYSDTRPSLSGRCWSVTPEVALSFFFHGMKRDLVFSPDEVKNGQAGFDSTIETMPSDEVKNEVKNGQKMLTFIKHTTKYQQTQQSPVNKYWSCLQGFICG